jgi:predicted DNA-binding transcriptional regulator AlpA
MPRTTNKTAAPRIVSFDELETLYGIRISRTQMRRDVAAGKFPAPRQLSRNRIGWLITSIEAHLLSCPVASYKKAG